MNAEVRKIPGLLIVLAVAGWALLEHPVAAELVLQRLYTSTPGPVAFPFSGLTQSPDGNFYGTVPQTGPTAYGFIYRVTPAGVFNIAVTFLGWNGQDPQGGLVLGSDGNLYGTTARGGTYGLGTLFRFTPGAPGGGFLTLHSFSGSDGAAPGFTLIQARDGFLYGVTMGYLTNHPAVFRATTSGTVTTLTNIIYPAYSSFMAPGDGLAEGPDGWLYGTTSPDLHLAGSIFKVSKDGSFKMLCVFPHTSGNPFPETEDRPVGGLTSGPDGFLYGTIGHSSFPSTTNNGSVFRMTTNGARTTLCSFARTNGANPMTRLTLSADGDFYGLTTAGGKSSAGTIFRVTTDGALTTLTDGFGDASSSIGPPPLFQARDGNFYGTALLWQGGTFSSLVFRLVTPLTAVGNAAGSGKLALTWNSFTNGVYRVEYKDTPDTTNWQTLGSSVTATGTTTSVSATLGAAPRRFYRVVLLP